jgi:hypothetical protein
MEFCFVSLFLKATTDLVPIGYRGALLSTLLHATVYVAHNLLNVLVQIANKMGLKKICTRTDTSARHVSRRRGRYCCRVGCQVTHCEESFLKSDCRSYVMPAYYGNTRKEMTSYLL